MSTQRIVRWDTGAVLWEGEAETVKDAVVSAVKAHANLGGADLRDANLRGANLGNADLVNADLWVANLRDANLRYANLGNADLWDANLRGANLGGANLGNADLRDANLGGANLRDANLRDANLRGANLLDANLGVSPERITPLLMLLDQPGRIRAYKLVTDECGGPFYGGIVYTVGATVSVSDADTDPAEHCGAGVNVATLDWCLKEWQPGYRVLVLEFTAADIACIPTATDGKFRLYRATVVGEKDISGLVGR